MTYFFITGTSQGLGKALATQALDKGAKVHGLSRSQPFEKEGYTHFVYDLSDLDNLEAMADKFFAVEGKPDRVVLINNAGTLGDVSYIGDWQANDIARTVAVNLTAPAVLMNAFVKTFGKMKATEKVVINISSGAAKKPYDGWSVYCTTKAGLEMYTKVLAAEMKKRDMTRFHIWSVAPGVVDTGMQDRLRESNPAHFSNLDRFLDLKKEGRLTPPEESAGKILSMLDAPEDFKDTVQDIRKF
ncbi:MAG: SDR family NAD(P)-dependent oxidoreductase [Cyclobacteriaceae bacterium]